MRISSTPFVALVRLRKVPNGNLVIQLTEAGKLAVRDWAPGYPPLDVLLEWHVCHGWDAIAPEETDNRITSDWIITDDFHRAQGDGELIYVGHVYYSPNSHYLNPAEELARHGQVVFAGADLNIHR